MMKGFMCIMLMVKTSLPLYTDVTGFLIRAWNILFSFIIVTLRSCKALPRLSNRILAQTHLLHGICRKKMRLLTKHIMWNIVKIQFVKCPVLVIHDTSNMISSLINQSAQGSEGLPRGAHAGAGTLNNMPLKGCLLTVSLKLNDYLIILRKSTGPGSGIEFISKRVPYTRPINSFKKI
ncbi:hypothetical protein Hanom_Chr15g01391621 [Helianthus anomalus]